MCVQRKWALYIICRPLDNTLDSSNIDAMGLLCAIPYKRPALLYYYGASQDLEVVQRVLCHDCAVHLHHFCGLHDLISLLPDDLPEKFTTADIAQKGKIPRNIAQQMAYCFRKTELIAEITQSKSGKVYERVS